MPELKVITQLPYASSAVARRGRAAVPPVSTGTVQAVSTPPPPAARQASIGMCRRAEEAVTAPQAVAPARPVPLVSTGTVRAVSPLLRRVARLVSTGMGVVALIRLRAAVSAVITPASRGRPLLPARRTAGAILQLLRRHPVSPVPTASIGMVPAV